MRLTYCIAAGAVALAIGFFNAPVRAADPPLKIVTANVVKIFNEIQVTKDAKVQADADAKALNNETIARQAKLRDLKSQRDQLRPDAPDYNKIQTQLVQEAINLKNWMDFQQQEMDRRQKQQIKDLFDRITAAIGKYAKENHIDFVISDQQPELPADLTQVTNDQLGLILRQRTLLYGASQFDITDAVITMMDKESKGG